MATLKIEAVATNGGAQQDDFTVFINENVGTNTLVGKIVGWEGTPNVTFRFHTEAGVPQNLNSRYKILQVGSDYYLAVDQGGEVNFNYEDETEVGNFHQQIWVEAVNPSGTVIHTGVYDVILNDIEPEGQPNPAPTNVRFVSTGNQAITINENTTAAGTVTATDTDTLSYSFETGGNGGGLFTINATTGAITLNSGVNFETMGANKFFDLVVLVSDGTNPATRQVLRVNVADVNEAASAVTFSNAQTIQAGTTGSGANVVLAAAVDPDTNPAFQNNQFRFSNGLATDPSGLFQINATTGQITTTRAVTAADVGQKNLVVVAYDGSLVSGTFTHNFNVQAAPNVAPTLAVNATSFTSTGGAVNPFTGLVAADADTADELTLTIRYTRANGTLEGLTDRDGVEASLTDSGTERTITLEGTAAALNDYLDGVSFDPIDTASTATTFRFTIKDDHSAVQDITTRVTVTSTINGNAPPVIADVPTNIQTVPDRGAVVQPFDDIEISDAGNLVVIVEMDRPTQGTFTGTGTYNQAAGTFRIEGTADQVTAALKALQFDPRDKAAGSGAEVTSFTITVTDPQNATATASLQVSATAPNAPPANRAPTGLGLSNVTVLELSKNSAEIATLSANDADGDNLSYKILLANGAAVDTDGYFTVSGNKLLVANGVMFDAEQAATRPITLQVSDGRGGTSTQTFTINISDKNPEIMTAADASPFNDIIKGSKTLNAKDVFYGGAGDDKLWGGYGNDTLWGGVGKDVFVFDGRLGTSSTDKRVNYDKIQDYSVKDDSIWLDNDLFKSNKKLYAAIKKGTETSPLKMAAKFFTVGDKAKQADDYFVYDAKKRVLYYDADGSGSKAAIEMATFTNNKALKSFGYKEFFFI